MSVFFSLLKWQTEIAPNIKRGKRSGPVLPYTYIYAEKGERKCHFSQHVFFSSLGKRDMREIGIFFLRARGGWKKRCCSSLGKWGRSLGNKKKTEWNGNCMRVGRRNEERRRPILPLPPPLLLSPWKGIRRRHEVERGKEKEGEASDFATFFLSCSVSLSVDGCQSASFSPSPLCIMPPGGSEAEEDAFHLPFPPPHSLHNCRRDRGNGLVGAKKCCADSETTSV